MVIEGHYSGEMTHKRVEEYLFGLAKCLNMTINVFPVTFTPDRAGNPLHKGINGFVAWVSSGCHIYTWRDFKFFTVDIYTCKHFNPKISVDFTKKFFGATKITWRDC